MSKAISIKPEDRIRFTFIRTRRGVPATDTKHPGIPVGCIAYRVRKDEGIFEYELSAHDPRDIYDGNLSRKIAEGRLIKHPRTFQFDPKAPLNFAQLLREASCSLIANPEQLQGGSGGAGRNVPKRVLQALAEHLTEEDVRGMASARLGCEDASTPLLAETH